MRHIAVLTGKRGGYGAMKPMLRLLDNDPMFRLSIIVTDQHVNPQFGSTIEEVQRDFFVAGQVDMRQEGGSPRDRAKALGVCLTGIVDVLSDLDPDLLILYGDRGEVLAAAIASVTLRIPIAHIQGGDISGNVDEVMRHALTKLSHLHFPSTEKSAARIIAMGEDPEKVFVVGDNHVDAIVARGYTSSEQVRRKFRIADDEQPIIVLVHPETTRQRDGYADMTMLMNEVMRLGLRTIVVYPCSDHGYEDIVRAILDFTHNPLVSTHRNIDAPDFWGLMNIAKLMIGNSSAGLIETPYLGLHSINVGERQRGRDHASNVIHCEFEPSEIADALTCVIVHDERTEGARGINQLYGDGRAGERIVEILRSIEIGPRLVDKRWRDGSST